MKGDRKRKIGRFTKNDSRISTYSHQTEGDDDISEPDMKYMRLPQDEFDQLVSSPSDEGAGALTYDCDGQICTDAVKLLRPTKEKPSLLDQICENEDDEHCNRKIMKIYQPIKLEIMWNEAIHQHFRQSPFCYGDLCFDKDGERKIGICWQERLKCERCQYVSATYKLYDEVESQKRGPNPAAPNIAIQMGLLHTSTGNTGLCQLLNAANIAAPAKSSLQKKANEVGADLVNVNKEDMKERCKKITELNMKKGLPADAPISIEGDCRYNNPLYSGVSKTPFQPSSQAVYTVCQNVTANKQILALSTPNKLCQTDAVNAGKLGTDLSPTCHKPDSDGKHPGHCSSTIAAHHSIGDEKSWARQCLEDLNDNNIKVKYITTDSDSKAAEAAKDMHREDKYSEMPVHLKDTRHLGGSQRRLIKKTTFSVNMFPERTVAQKTKMQNRFADDMRTRCSTECSRAFEKYGSDLDVVKRHLSHTSEAIIKCCQGDHTMCKKHSFVCDGVPSESRVWRFMYLPPNYKLNCSECDIELLRKCIQFRLSVKTINETIISVTQRALPSHGISRHEFTVQHSNSIMGLVHP